MEINKFNKYRIGKLRQISKNLKKIKLLVDSNFLQKGGYSKKEIDAKYRNLVSLLGHYQAKIENEVTNTVREENKKELQAAKDELEYIKRDNITKINDLTKELNKIKDIKNAIELSIPVTREEMTKKEGEIEVKNKQIETLRLQIEESNKNNEENNRLLLQINLKLNEI